MKLLAVTIAVLMSLLTNGMESASAGPLVRLLDADGAPVTDAVIYLDGVDNHSAVLQKPVVVDQINKQFVPRITVVQEGAIVEFPNQDAVSHHVYSFANPNSFELPLYKGEKKPTIRFDHAGLVTLGCNIHDLMLGYILVVETPYHAITDSNGLASLTWADKLNAGGAVKVWSPDLAGGDVLNATRRQPDAGDHPDVVAILIVDARQQAVVREDGSSLSWGDY